MAPESRAAAADIARLRTEIAEDRAALSRCIDDVRDVLSRWAGEPPDRPYLFVAAVALHGWYTGLETILERIARQIDDAVPAGETSHRDLLSQLMTEVPGLRPAVLDRSLMPDLRALLAFRHFFRHAYAIDVDPQRLRAQLDRLTRIEASVGACLSAFDEFLNETLRALTAG